MKKNILSFLLLIIAAIGTVTTFAQPKGNIKVLIVAHNPAKEYTKAYAGPKPTPKQKQMAKSRGAEFKQLLSDYFNVVDVIHSDSYTAEASKGYDVTIFDDLPNAIDTLDLGMYTNGKSIYQGDYLLRMPRYIPEDFTGAIISIGQITDDLTYTIPSKIRTQCHCIERAYLYNTQSEHAIFQSPISVQAEYEMVKTPSNFKKYFSGVGLPDSLRVRQMQTINSKDDYWVGQIVIGMGFDDTPDCEFISSSQSAKDITGMALERSANIFHWGFAASPKYMTEQAKQIFVNTVYYMSKFGGRHSMTKCYVADSRDWAKEFCFRKTGHQLDEKFITTGDAERDSIWFYYKENYPYFYMKRGEYGLSVDQQAKQLKIANYSKEILSKAITLLQDVNTKQTGLDLLSRYTDYRYDNYQQWSSWYQKYSKYLFFTELGGYKFMIDNWNNPTLEMPSKVIEKNDDQTDVIEEQIVKISAKASKIETAKNLYRLEIAIDIKEGWHIYASEDGNETFIITKIEIHTPNGVKLYGDMKCPQSHNYEAMPTIKIYKNRCVFSQEFTAIDSSKLDEIKCKILFQACDDYQCKPPQTIDVKIIK